MPDARNRRNVLVGAPNVEASGGISLGPVQASKAVPKDATTPVEIEGQKPVGYISQDGVTKTVDRSTEKIKDWDGDTVKVLITDHSVTIKFTAMEAANADLLKAVYGEKNVTAAEDGKIKTVDNADELPHYSWQWDIKGDENSKIRLFAPDAQVTNVGDVAFVRSDVIKYELELECFNDDSNVKFYQFIDKGEDPKEE